MRKLLLVAISAVLLLALSGCGTEVLIDGHQYSSVDGFSMSYKSFTGKRTITCALKADTVIKVDVVTNSGALAMKITDSHGDLLFSGSKMPTNSFTVTTRNDDEYTIEVSAIAHVSGFQLAWGGEEPLAAAEDEPSPDDNKFVMTYDHFTGVRSAKASLKTGDLINISVTTNSGEIAIRIVDSKGDTLYTGTKTPTSSFIVSPTYDDEYTIEVTTKDHSSGFSITWE